MSSTKVKVKEAKAKVIDAEVKEIKAAEEKKEKAPDTIRSKDAILSSIVGEPKKKSAIAAMVKKSTKGDALSRIVNTGNINLSALSES